MKTQEQTVETKALIANDIHVLAQQLNDSSDQMSKRPST